MQGMMDGMMGGGMMWGMGLFWLLILVVLVLAAGAHISRQDDAVRRFGTAH